MSERVDGERKARANWPSIHKCTSSEGSVAFFAWRRLTATAAWAARLNFDKLLWSACDHREVGAGEGSREGLGRRAADGAEEGAGEASE